jgi:hypothetical protein
VRNKGRSARLLLVCLGLGVFITALPVRAIDLHAYVGKYVSDKVKGKTIYQVPDVKKSIIEIVGADKYGIILEHGTSDGCKPHKDSEFGELLVCSQCQPHNCPFASVAILKMNGTALGICFEDAEQDGKWVEWAGKGWQKKTTGAISCFGAGEASSEAEDAVTAFKAAGK